MPRNSSGTYSLPVAAFSAGGVIKAADHNSNYSDIAAALTQSLATTGVSVMTGPIKAATGTAAAPGYAFGSDAATGFYLAGTHQIGWAYNGATGATFNSDGSVAFNGSMTVGGTLTIAGTIPISFAAGVALPFYNATAPLGWTKVTTINDYAMRVVSGTGGVTGGSTAFSSVFTARTISTANMPSHNHSVTDPGHTHTTTFGGAYTYFGSSGGFGGIAGAASAASTASATTGITIGNNGSGTAMDFAVLYADFIICTKNP